MTDYRARYERWLASDAVDEATKAELRAIAEDEKEIEDRFYKDLEFGTGGLRGILDAGTNRMNVYTVRRATQGLANYLLMKDPLAKEKGVAIAYDSRHQSDVFALETAAVFNGNGIKAYVFESLRPTPELSFAVRTLGCKGGIVITASHNPSKYNGYKAYWEDGCQVPPPMDEEIIREVEKVDLFDGVRVMPRREAEDAGLFVSVGEELDRQYIDLVKSQLLDPEMVRAHAADLTVVYTPLHGTGNRLVRRALAECGFTNVYVVPEQEKPDGDFPTVPYPNPEDVRAFGPAIALGEQVGADILIATDPDADRVGIMVRTDTGYQHFTGNMTGVLLSSYILEARKKTGHLPADGFLVKTIVTTEMIRALTDAYGVELREVLTGFKYIGQQILEAEKAGRGTYLFGFEESFGYLSGTYARDKDAVSASLLVCEMAAVYKAKNQTLLDALHELYERYGYYKETLVSFTFEGIEGIAKMNSLMEELRQHPQASYGGLKVLECKDYAAGLDGLPPSNVLRFTLENNSWFCARPSGTEPKIKFYFGVKGESQADADAVVERLQSDVTKTIK